MVDEIVEPWRARMLLILGGCFGLHRLYLKQIPEAFVFFSTIGVFALGCLHDSFLFRHEVDEYNREIEEETDFKENSKEKYRKGKLQSAQSKFIGFSFTRFLYSVLYGTWLGLLAWLACTVTFGWTDIDHVPFITVLSVAVSAGVYIIGQCGGQSRELSYIWISAFSAMFIMIRLAHVSVFRAVFFTSNISTVIGNRSAKNRRRSHSIKHFVFWSSLYCMLVCVIILGCSRKIMDKQVTATRPGDFRETVSVGSLLRDRFFDTKRVYSFFRGNPIIEYNLKPSTADFHKQKFEKYNNKKQGLWQRIWSGDMFDEWTGAAQLTKIDWIELTTVFVIDILRCESRVVEGNTKVEPFQWAAWRNYLIHRFDLEPLVDDEILRSECQKWLRSNYGSEKEKKEQDEKDFGALATRKGCTTFQS